jgi:hypothetical protein
MDDDDAAADVGGGAVEQRKVLLPNERRRPDARRCPGELRGQLRLSDPSTLTP